jgi:hypothetical protein
MCWKHHATTLNFCETKPKGRSKGPQSKLVEAKTHQIKGRECAERSFNCCRIKRREYSARTQTPWGQTLRWRRTNPKLIRLNEPNAGDRLSELLHWQHDQTLVDFCETKPTADRDGHIETGGRGENGMVVALGENSIQYTDRPTARISRHSSRIFLPRIIAISLEDGCDPPR